MKKDILICGVGGQGTVLASKILAASAMVAGDAVHSAETIGMAQRGGSVASSVRFGEKVCSPIIPAGESDLLVAFDRLEALRCASQLKSGGKALVNDVYLTPVTVSSGQQPEVEDLAGSLKAALPAAVYVDAAAVAKEVGNDRTANMVIAGALSALTPFPEELWKKAMAETFTGPKAKLLEVNEKAFARGRAAVAG